MDVRVALFASSDARPGCGAACVCASAARQPLTRAVRVGEVTPQLATGTLTDALRAARGQRALHWPQMHTWFRGKLSAWQLGSCREHDSAPFCTSPRTPVHTRAEAFRARVGR